MQRIIFTERGTVAEAIRLILPEFQDAPVVGRADVPAAIASLQKGHIVAGNIDVLGLAKITTAGAKFFGFGVSAPKSMLDEVNVTQEAYAAWQAIAERMGLVLAQLEALGREVGEIPIERGRVEDDDSLTIFVEIPGVLDVSMSVPPDHWMWRDPKKNN